MDPVSQVFCLRWNNHRSNLLTVLDHLLQTEVFCDVTLACDGASIKCHKMILSACSEYFQKLFMENSCEHPIVFLKDIKYEDIRAILDYMYKGEVNVAQEQLPALLKVAELLKVKGLVEEEREKLLNSGRKEGRPLVTTSEDSCDRPRSSSGPKVNGGEAKDPVPSSSASTMRPFMYTPPTGGPQFPMWPLPGIFPGAHNLFKSTTNANKEDREDKESIPSPKESGNGPIGAAKRKKTASGSAGSASSKDSGPPPGSDSTPQLPPNLLHPLPENKVQQMIDTDDLAKDNNGIMNKESPGSGGGGIANYVPSQRLEWKRYKQYTRNDIMSAIEEVKKGMSALQASRKYGVPSRTLYDKVKKMGITTGRQMQRKSLPNYPASFPALGGMMNQELFKDIADRYKDMDESTNDSSSQPGDDSRATLVPTSGGFPTLQMLNIMEKMKENERAGGDGKPDVSLTPMNLSTMLGRDFRRSDDGKMIMGGSHQPGGGRLSDSSLSPNGGDDETEMEEDGHDEEADDEETRRGSEAESSTGGRDRDRDRDRSRQRHTSADIRAQFMADLRRLGGNIPTQSGNEEQQAATSTTASPPPKTQATPEDNLPPRKRKVSQEQHTSSSNLATPSDPRARDNASSPPLNMSTTSSSGGEERTATSVSPSLNGLQERGSSRSPSSKSSPKSG